MTLIHGMGVEPTAASAAARRNRAAGGFRVPSDPRAAGAPAGPDASPVPDASTPTDSAPVFAAFMEGLLGLQEATAEAPSVAGARDREARRHGQALLSALAEMQLSLVAQGDAPAALASLSVRMSGLAAAVPLAADPRLRAIVAAIALRARLELARHRT